MPQELALRAGSAVKDEVALKVRGGAREQRGHPDDVVGPHSLVRDLVQVVAKNAKLISAWYSFLVDA